MPNSQKHIYEGMYSTQLGEFILKTEKPFGFYAFNFQSLDFQICRSLMVLAKGKLRGRKKNCFLGKISCLPQKMHTKRSSCDMLMSQDNKFMPPSSTS